MTSARRWSGTASPSASSACRSIGRPEWTLRPLGSGVPRYGFAAISRSRTAWVNTPDKTLCTVLATHAMMARNARLEARHVRRQ